MWLTATCQPLVIYKNQQDSKWLYWCQQVHFLYSPWSLHLSVHDTQIEIKTMKAMIMLLSCRQKTCGCCGKQLFSHNEAVTNQIRCAIAFPPIHRMSGQKISGQGRGRIMQLDLPPWTRTAKARSEKFEMALSASRFTIHRHERYSADSAHRSSLPL